MMMTSTITMTTIFMMTMNPTTATSVPAASPLLDPPRVCETDWGETLVFEGGEGGEEKRVVVNDTCNMCTCSEDGQLDCRVPECGTAFCEDHVTPDHGCCPLCPGGPWCRTPTAPFREIQGLGQGERKQKGCEVCKCDLDRGRDYTFCWTQACRLTPPCVDSHVPPGGCCPVCLNGKNCKIPATGDIIPFGRKVEQEGEECACPTVVPWTANMTVQEWFAKRLVAVCTPIASPGNTVVTL